MKRPELLAPGGSFLAAYYAFEAGADSVYLGLKEFSARKAAVNFSLEQLRRILGVARERGRRVYLALNTVVREQELERAAEALFWAESLGVDGVIVQDLGVYELARRHFPRLALHASTQMAVHNVAGLRTLRELGFQRAILARELGLDEIRLLREAQTGVELEVFVHGALCYSVSGLCLASWALTGRSGNRGDCAQICRSLFRVDGGQEDGGPRRPEEGHFFSCRDLYVGKEVLRLIDAGVSAFKIEGRMKSPEYVYNTVRLYRALIDRGETIPAQEYAELERKAALGFAREQTRGYLHNPRGEAVLDPAFPGHRGAVLGRVDAASGNGVRLRLEADLSLRDGLGYFPPSGARDPLVFSVRAIQKDGRSVPFARAGELVDIPLPEAPAEQLPAAGQRIYQLSSRFLDLPQPKEGGFPLWKVPFDAAFRLAGQPTEEAGLRLEVRLTALAGANLEEQPGGRSGARGFRWEQTVPVQRAARPRAFRPILEQLFRESAESLLVLSGSEARFENLTGMGDDELFVPPSALKKAKNAFYAALARWLDARLRQRLAAVRDDDPCGEPAQRVLEHGPPLDALEVRQDLSPSTPPGAEPSLFPFASPTRPLRLEDLAQVAGWTVLPLAPVLRAAQQPHVFETVREQVAGEPQRRFLIGLSNLSHLALAAAMAGVPNAAFFVDFHLYVANRFAFGFFARRVPRLLFQYSWIEGSEEEHQELLRALHRDAGPGAPAQAAAHAPGAVGSPALLRIAAGFRPPLFYALSCPVGQEALSDPAREARDQGAGARGCKGCSRRIAVPLRQSRRRFRLEVRDCLACLYEAR